MGSPVLKRCRRVLKVDRAESDCGFDDPCFDEMTLRELSFIWEAKRRKALRLSGSAESGFDAPACVEEEKDVLEEPVCRLRLNLHSKPIPDRRICQQKVSFSSSEDADSEKVRNSSVLCLLNPVQTKCLETTVCADGYSNQALDNPVTISGHNNTLELCALNQIPSEIVEVDFWDTLDWLTDEDSSTTICSNDLKPSVEADASEYGTENSTSFHAEVNLCKESIELCEEDDAIEVGMEASGTSNSPCELDDFKEELSELRNNCELDCPRVYKCENVGIDCYEDQTSSRSDDPSILAGGMKELLRQESEGYGKKEESAPVVLEEKISREALADLPERVGVEMRNTHFSSSLVCQENFGPFGYVSLRNEPVKSCGRLSEAGSLEVMNHDSCVTLSATEVEGIPHYDWTCSSQDMCNMQSITVDELLESTPKCRISLIKSNATRGECGATILSDGVQQKDNFTHKKHCSTCGANAESTSFQSFQPRHRPARRKHLVGKNVIVTEKVSSSPDDSVRSDKLPHFDTRLIMRAKHISVNFDDVKPEFPHERFLSTTKVIFPSSKRKLCQAAAIGDMFESTHHLSKKSIGKTRETIPLKCNKKSDGDRDKSSPLFRTPDAISYPLQTDAQKAVNFSKRQMGDTRYFANKLLRKLNFIRRNMEGILRTEVSPLVCSKSQVEKMRNAAITAYELEEFTNRWLSQMTRDSSRFCKIMNATRNEDTKAEIIPKHRRKIMFADEAGGMLCHVKTFDDVS